MLPQLRHAMSRNALVLAAFAVASVGGVSLLHLGTTERIKRSHQAFQAKAFAEILPPHQHDNDLLASRRLLRDPRLGNTPQPAYIAYQNNRPTAAILQVSTSKGYNGTLQLLVGIYADGRLAGVRVLQHQETPGLGDKIETAKSDWIFGFAGLSLNNPDEKGWAVQKDGGQFDQFAGATITPRAVVGAVHQALQFFQQYGSALLEGRDPLPSVEPSTIQTQAGATTLPQERERTGQ